MESVFGDILQFMVDAFYKLTWVTQSMFGFLSQEFAVGDTTFTVVEMLFGIGLLGCLTWAIFKFLLPT